MGQSPIYNGYEVQARALKGPISSSGFSNVFPRTMFFKTFSKVFLKNYCFSQFKNFDFSVWRIASFSNVKLFFFWSHFMLASLARKFIRYPAGFTSRQMFFKCFLQNNVFSNFFQGFS